ncbi:hypothetical protein [Selenomonas bovis]|uniref:hypothetical protein n=1 Tax=Selenomonas bovis TaxID=416586 RepID=UPI00068F20A4|nr:hypothetical protein [Selenomonas bovis]
MAETKRIEKLPVSKQMLESFREALFQRKAQAAVQGLEDQLDRLQESLDMEERLKGKAGITIANLQVKYRVHTSCLMPVMTEFTPTGYVRNDQMEVNGKQSPFDEDQLATVLQLAGRSAQYPTTREVRDAFTINSSYDIANNKTWGTIFCKNPDGFKKYYLNVSDGRIKDLDAEDDTWYPVIPFIHLHGINSEAISGNETLLLWLKNNLRPYDGFFGSQDQIKMYAKALELAKSYGDLLILKDDHIVLDKDKIIADLREGKTYDFVDFDAQAILKMTELPADDAFVTSFSDRLLHCDERRAALDPYDANLLTSEKRGHWDLWDAAAQAGEDGGMAALGTAELWARNPASDVKSSFVAIDFGTKSTVVAYESKPGVYLPLQIGSGTYSQGVHLENYENPTIVHFLDIPAFLAAYRARDGRPETSWETLTVSSTAKQDLDTNGAGEQYATFFEHLKHWCGAKNERVKIRDQKGNVFDLPGFLELAEADLNPVEVYAYYIGLYLNNMLGEGRIFLRYLMSFPVTYEIDVRERIRRSFERGIRKSLPTALLSNETAMKKFAVRQGASEPAAYAATALKSFGFEPDGEHNAYYSVFDFGGGTTDFDFGMLGAPQKDRYDGCLTHFGANGDGTLGGENLLRLLAFEVFKGNRDLLLHPKDEDGEPIGEKFSFTWAADKEEFLGSEALIKASQEAHQNMHNLMEKLRPVWEAPDGDEAKQILNQGTVQVLLFSDGEKTPRLMTLKIQSDNGEPLDLTAILRDRIERGVRNFFIAMKEAFDVSTKVDSPVLPLQETGEIAIFLAGNSSRSPLVKEIFDAYLASGKTAEEPKEETSETSDYEEPKSKLKDQKELLEDLIVAAKANGNPQLVEWAQQLHENAVALKESGREQELREWLRLRLKNTDESATAAEDYWEAEDAAPDGKNDKKTEAPTVTPKDSLRTLLGLAESDTLPTFRLFPPLGTPEADALLKVNPDETEEDKKRRPTAKTGVAYGLLACRTTYQVVDLVPEGTDSVSFQYYVGKQKRGKFCTVIGMNTPMMKWYPFTDAGEEDFDILYTDKPEAATNEAPARIAQLRTESLDEDLVDEDAVIYLRAVAPRVIEYTIAPKDAAQETIGAPTERMPEPVRITLG